VDQLAVNLLRRLPCGVVNRKAVGWGGGAAARGGPGLRVMGSDGASVEHDQEQGHEHEEPEKARGLRSAAGQRHEEHIDGQRHRPFGT
jgi:hypothetical protein